METHTRVRAQRSRRVQQVEPGIQPPRRLECVAIDQSLSARKVRHLDAAQIHRHPATGLGRHLRSAVHLQAADFDVALLGQDGQRLLDLHASRDQGPRDDCAEALHGEHAIDRQPRGPVRPAHRHRGRQGHQRVFQKLQPVPRARRHRDNGSIGEKRSRDELAHFEAGELQGLAVAQVALGENDQTSGDVQQPADVKVLTRLRHDRLVGRDDEHHEVHAADSGEHVLHEAFVAGHVHEREG